MILTVIIVIGAGFRPDVPVEQLKAKYANEQSKFITIGVHYRDMV